MSNALFKFYGRVSPGFRRKRMQQFADKMRPTKTTTILDVGGYPWFWREEGAQVDADVTVLNLQFPPEAKKYESERVKMVEGDGTKLQYEDLSFDIVFSNSVIEHLSIFENQKLFADEIQRVGKSYWIQTPAFEFPVEPHFLAPVIHWLPKKRLPNFIVRYMTGWGILSKPNAQQISSFLNEIRLLRRREIQNLFPNCNLIVERFASLPKSYIAYSNR